MRTCAILIAALTAFAQSPDRLIGSGVNFYSLKKESELGAIQAEAQLKKSTPTSHPEVRAYVERLGNRLVAEIPGPKRDYHFAVIVQDPANTHETLEPLVLAGGYIFVSENLIRAAQDEAEFAGMLAHSVAHAAARHLTRLLTRREVVEMANVQASVPLFDSTTPLGMYQFSRAFELEADGIATQVMASAGFNPENFARYLGRTQRDDKNNAFSPLPTASARIQKIATQIGRMPMRTYTATGEFSALQKKLQ